MPFKTPNVGPMSVFREHLTVNNGSFSTSQNDSDLWIYTARVDGTPARTGHLHDSTAYATSPVEDSWEMRLAGVRADNRGGNQT